ncbi:MAG: TonB-dependent receptor [Steroidobacteraceae bacterium]
MKSNGFVSVPDVLRSITENAGETQSQQSFSGASFTPGAQQVDLRGLGPNHTLVLVNGRRIADFPLPFKGRSNFTDISNIPLGMVDSIEVLSGSASAIYGSDAIAGVVNFNLKKKTDGIQFDYRYGTTEAGGGRSHRLTLVDGWSNGNFDSVVGVEFQDKQPIWAYQRSIQDSTADNPTTDGPIARRDFLRYDPIEDAYVDPGAAACAPLARLNGGSIYYASRPNWGPYDPATDGYLDGHYCGSNTSIGYGTIENKRRSVSVYASFNYRLGDNATAFADFQLGHSKVSMFSDVTDWQFADANGSEDGNFYNQFSGALDNWYRHFTPEEMGGLNAGMIKNTQRTFSITPGIKGSFGSSDWQYEASFNHSQFNSEVSWPEIVAAKANALFFGPQLGVDPDSGYPIFNADPTRLYTALTRAEYDSIAQRTVYHPRSRTDGLSFTVNTPRLFDLPAGPLGFAAVAEYGEQSYRLNTDPLALTDYYYGLRDSDGTGSRTHWAGGYEFSIPVIQSVKMSHAGRYDAYRFAGNSANKFTYNFGVEWRPLESLLVRGSYGTGFRAPDLHYVYSGPGHTHPSATDYYLCRTLEPDTDIGDCSYADEGIVESRQGNRSLKSETAKSLTYGFVWAPFSGFDIQADYFNIRMTNQVLDMSIDSLLRVEAACRIGTTESGSTVDVNSPTCQDAFARVSRYSPTNPATPNGLIGVSIVPVNIAKEKTSGYDLSMHYRLPTPAGTFKFAASYTYVKDHTRQQYPGDPTVNMFQVDSNFDIPRSKASASLGWQLQNWTATIHGQRLDKLPNYDEDAFIPATYLFNASLQWSMSSHARLALLVDNLFDKNPPKDPTYASYPYYDISWFDSVGRSYYLQFTYKLGGKPLNQ